MHTEEVVSPGAQALLPDRPTLLYDDGCRFCRFMAEVLLRLSRASELAVLPWSAPAAQAWIAGLAPAVRDASMHLKMPDGTLLSGNHVLAATLAFVRGFKWLAWLARRLRPISSVVAWGYGFAARRREFLSKCVPYRKAVERAPRLR